MLLLDRFIAVSKERESHPSFIHKGETISYGLLADWFNKLSYYFLDKIDKGDKVAILLDNCPEYAVGVYASWQAGGVVVGLNTSLKADDLTGLINHCGAKWLIADASNRQLSKLLEACDFNGVILLGDNGSVLEQIPPLVSLKDIFNSQIGQPPKSISIDQDSLAAIIYTSGTTGNPKGVMLSHNNLASNITSIQSYLPLRSDDKTLCILPFFYSYGNSILHSNITAGACLVLENSLMYPHKVLGAMVEHKVTAFSGVPSSYYLFLSRTKLAEYDLSSLRYCTQAGGAMDPVKIDAWREQVDADFYVMYGQTEASARLSYLPPDQLKNKSASVGISIPGVELSVRLPSGDPCKRGEKGEVCARGNNVMLSYFNAPDETAKVLKNGWLYTGDLGYFDEDEFLYLVGRNKEMIKSGAHRINPREIEETIASLEGVDEVAVVGKDDELLGQVIRACIVTSLDETTLKKTIMQKCRQNLATYKIPKELLFLKELPKTASGKIKKHLI